MRTAELSGAALDWAVAKCEGLLCFGYRTDGKRFAVEDSDGQVEGFMPATNWEQGGAIIEREGISICNLEANAWEVEGWTASKGELWSPSDDGWVSPTPLIAAMRCYVASKLGDEVELPEELLSCAHD